MKTSILKSLLLLAALATGVTSCHEYEDEGPLQYQEESYSITDFDRLEMGDAFIIRVEQGNYFSIRVRGDRRNLDDLEVRKNGNTLIVHYDDYEQRHHETFIDIIVPTLTAAHFSGASNSVITGFDELSALNLQLSGASIAQVDATAEHVDLNLSGASIAELRGEAVSINAGLSGASSLKAFSFPVQSARLQVSGASVGRVTVGSTLNATVTGASTVRYRGNPTITSDVSGASSLQKD
jgi:hypothetical protein